MHSWVTRILQFILILWGLVGIKSAPIGSVGISKLCEDQPVCLSLPPLDACKEGLIQKLCPVMCDTCPKNAKKETGPSCEPECQNGGNCIDENVCECLPGYSGNFCQEAVCKETCHNGGICMGPDICACLPGFIGPLCQNVKVCEDDPLCAVLTTNDCKDVLVRGRCPKFCKLCESSHTHGHSCNGDCSSEFDPVCGNDGVTYDNLCMLQLFACWNPELNLIDEHKGQCLKNCAANCYSTWSPVCGTDGKTYENFCQLTLSACWSPNKNIVRAYSGECRSEVYTGSLPKEEKESGTSIGNFTIEVRKSSTRSESLPIEEKTSRLSIRRVDSNDTGCHEGYDNVGKQCLNVNENPKSWVTANATCKLQNTMMVEVRDLEVDRYLDDRACDSPFDLVTGGCVWVNPSKMTWKDAKEDCESQGATLFIPKGKLQVVQLGAWIKEKQFKEQISLHYEDTYYWIGGQTSDRTWLNGDAITSGWKYGEPSGQECVHIEFLNTNNVNSVAIDDMSCSQSHYFVCQKDPKSYWLGATDTWIEGVCAEENPKVGGQCIYTSERQLTWSDAQQACENMKATLLRPQVDTLITEYYTQSLNNNVFWLGLSDTLGDRYYGPFEKIWDNDQCVNIGITSGKSVSQCMSNCDATPGCTAINYKADPESQCILRACELPVPQPKWDNSPYQGFAISDNCDGVRVGSQCLIFIEDPKTWIDARDHCESLGANLVSISNPDELRKYANENHGGKALWLGGTDSAEEGKWIWVNGAPFKEFPWDGAEPNGRQNENCLMVNDAGFNDANCSHPLNFICQSNLNYWMGDSYKDASFDKPLGLDYGCMSIGPKGFTRTQCHDRNLFLCDLSHVKEWRWVSGLKVTNDFRWSQQSDGTHGEQCMAYTYLGSYGGQRCIVDKPFLCEDKCPIENHKVASQCLYISTERAQWQAASQHCEDMDGEMLQPQSRQLILDFYTKEIPQDTCDGVRVGSQCLIYVEDPKTWIDARDHCESLGANLVHLSNPDELRKYANENHGGKALWLGGTDSAEEGKWIWLNGAPFKDFPWAGVEPNGRQNENCLMVNDAGFNDAICSHLCNFICQSNMNYWMGASYKDTWMWDNGSPLEEPYSTDIGTKTYEHCMFLGDHGFKSMRCNTHNYYICDLSKAFNRGDICKSPAHTHCAQVITCGSDGFTYSTSCSYKEAKCRNPKLLEVSCAGDLDDCTSLDPSGSWQAVYRDSPGCSTGTQLVETAERDGAICCQPIGNAPGNCTNGCHNGGTCIGTDNCVCTFGWTGPSCEITSIRIDFNHPLVIENLIDIGSLLEITWRTDLRCGPNFTMNGRPSTCNPNSEQPCCSPCGWCGNTKIHCLCRECNDYRQNANDYSIAIAIRALIGICRNGDSCDITIETLLNLVEQEKQNIRDLELRNFRKIQLLQDLQLETQFTNENLDKLMGLKFSCIPPFANLGLSSDECVLLRHVPKTWKEADEDCKSQDAYLYIPDSDNFDPLQSYMFQNRISLVLENEPFIGASNAPNKPYTWVDGSATSSSAFLFPPDTSKALCGGFNPFYKKLVPVVCTEKRQYICEK